MREPLRWCLDLGRRLAPQQVSPALHRAALGPCDACWTPPRWLLAHQVTAARRIAARLDLFRGAVLADAVGLGKTYVALAVATRYRTAVVVVPASLAAQWRRVMSSLAIGLPVATHEALSRGASVPAADLVIVDEAHRFRNPKTRRYDRLARAMTHQHLLLLTATPVVNRAADLIHLLRLFLPDHGLALQGTPSIAETLAARAPDALAQASAAVIVARSPAAVRQLLPALPHVGDAETVSLPPVPPEVLERLTRGIDTLAFPSFADRQAAELLRLHLWYRLASSAPALRDTLRRHAAYLDHAIAAARRGERLSRSAALALFGTDQDFQLELGALATGATEVDAAALVAERDKIRTLRAQLRPVLSDPKAERLEALLAGRARNKTLVFTTAVATAAYLARRLQWRRVCAATARGARIASGRIPLDEALALFAPGARGVPPPPPVLELNTLIATDLLSEGLDLQDADAVVHYDLPWTPLRLEQRLGRIARIGSRHGGVRVWWFAPSATIEACLGLVQRLQVKVDGQLRLGVPTSSAVGRARILGGLFDWRERLAALDGGSPATPCFAVVRAPAIAAIGLHWTVGTRVLPELLVLAGEPPAVVCDERTAAELVQLLLAAPPSLGFPPIALTDALHAVVRGRLADAMSGPRDPETRELARRTLRRGAHAARRRKPTELQLLDAVLNRLTTGVPTGPARSLSDLLAGRTRSSLLRRWLDSLPTGRGSPPLVTLAGALLGDGTLNRTPQRGVYSTDV